ncbi:hypothetical protein LY78DRAFT_282239 [Colletotrichum sublineola]|nr:hypothetical protein LY78DRAFT_282239 [Colletotrichum sublineola]
MGVQPVFRRERTYPFEMPKKLLSWLLELRQDGNETTLCGLMRARGRKKEEHCVLRCVWREACGVRSAFHGSFSTYLPTMVCICHALCITTATSDPPPLNASLSRHGGSVALMHIPQAAYPPPPPQARYVAFSFAQLLTPPPI